MPLADRGKPAGHGQRAAIACPSKIVAPLLALLASAVACDDAPPNDEQDVPCTDPLFCPPDVIVDDTGDAGGEPELSEFCTADDQCAEGTYCDTETGDCLTGCRLAPDSCEGECAFCRPVTRTCDVDRLCQLDCDGDEDCDNDQYCDATEARCLTGCRPDATDCPNPELGYCCTIGEFCDADTHTCRDLPCASDTECATAQFCNVPEDDPDGAECAAGCRLQPDNCRTVFQAGPTSECNPDTHRCRVIDCGTEDSRCPTGYVCEDGSCRSGCRSSDECASDQPCDPETRLCGCGEDEDCDETSVCIDERCRPRCDANDDCRGTTPYCNSDRGRCFGGCSNEAGEPNGTRTSAVDIGNGAIFSGVLCGVEQDWFRFQGNAGETIRAELGFDPGTLTITWRDSAGAELVTRTETSADGLLVIGLETDVAATGPVFLQVSGQGLSNEAGRMSLGYSGAIERFAIGSCRVDDFEDDDTFDEATALDEGTLADLTLCANDPGGDNFAVALPPDEQGEVTISFDSADGDLDLVLFDSTLAEVERVDSGTGTEFVLIGPEEAASDWFVRVVGGAAGEEADYTLSYNVTPLAACQADAGEDDDDDGEATETQAAFGLPPVTFSGRTACAGDDDWYSIGGLGGSGIRVELTQSSATRDVRIEVLRPTLGAPLAFIENNALDKEIEVLNLPVAGTYYVRIVDAGPSEGSGPGDGVGYAVSFEALPPICDDFFEDDDDAGTASLIVDLAEPSFDSDTFGALRMCPDDPDWFELDLGRAALVEGTLSAAGSIADFVLTLTDDAEDLIATARVVTETEQVLDPRRLSSGSYYLHLEPGGFLPLAGQAYRLRVDAEFDPVPCVDTGLEDNDSLVDAVLAGSGQSGERVCADDPDYWLVPLAVPSRVQVDWRFGQANPGVRVTLFEVTGTTTQRALQTVGDAEGQLAADFVNGDALIVIEELLSGVVEGGVAYDFDVTVTPLDICQPGPNNSAVFAEDLAADQPIARRVCAGSELWYLVDLPANQRHTFTTTGSAVSPVVGMDLRAFATPGVPVATANTLGDGAATISSTALAGLYFVRIFPDGAGVPPTGLAFELGFTSEAVPVCPEDALEVNDAFAQAAPVAGNVPETLFVCDGDSDWLEFEVPGASPQPVTLTIEQQDTTIPLSLTLLGPDGIDVIDEIADARTQSTLALEALDPGTYFVVIEEGSLGNPPGGTPYTFGVEVGALVCTDVLEPDDSLVEATQLVPNALHHFPNLKACGNDDRFVMDVADGTNLTATVNRAAPSVAMLVRLLDADGGLVLSQAGAADDPSFELVALDLAAGVYQVVITATGAPAAGEIYDLTIDVVAPFVCDDEHEPNETLPTATFLGASDPGGEPGLLAASATGRLCLDDVDVYSIATDVGPVVINVETNPLGEGDFGVALLDENGIELGSGTSIEVSDLPDGEYFVRLDGFEESSGGLPYQLSIASTASGCPIDRLEPNEVSGSELPAAPGLNADPLYLCAPNEDWFRFAVSDGPAEATVIVSHDAVAAPVLVEVRTLGGSVLESDQSTDPLKLLSLEGLANGTYEVRLQHVTGTPPPLGVSYAVSVTVTGGGTCTDDGLEPNDTAGTAVSAPIGTEGALSCPGDADWYALNVLSTEGDIRVQVESVDPATFVVSLFEEDGTSPLSACTDFSCDLSGICTCEGPLDDAEVSGPGSPPLALLAPELPAGRYLVSITSDVTDSEGIVYSIGAEAVERGCLPDEWEPNDTLGAAVAPTDGDTPLAEFSARLCPLGDEDFFELENQGDMSVAAFVDGYDCPSNTPEVCTPDGTSLCGPLRFQLYDPGGDPVTGLVVIGAPGTYTLGVSTCDAGELPGIGQNYDIRWTTTP